MIVLIDSDLAAGTLGADPARRAAEVDAEVVAAVHPETCRGGSIALGAAEERVAPSGLADPATLERDRLSGHGRAGTCAGQRGGDQEVAISLDPGAVGRRVQFRASH